MKRIEAKPGESFYNSVRRAKNESENQKCPVKLIFNQCEIDVHHTSRLADLAVIYDLMRELNRSK